jgi:hypothetical protein
MSTKDQTDGLTDKQRAAFDNYTDYCAKNYDKLAGAMQLGCLDHAATLGVMAKQRQAQQDMLALAGLAQTRLEEVAIVNEWVGRWQTQAAAMLASFVNASFGYDMILGLKSAKPVEYNVILELAICLLPELKPCQRIFQGLASRAKASADTADALAQIGITLGTPTTRLYEQFPQNFPVPKTPEMLNLLDRRSKDITNVARAGAKSGGGNILDDASVRLKSGYRSKNEIFKKLVSQTVTSLLAATAAVSDLNTRILKENAAKANLPNLSKTDLLAEIGKSDPGPVLTADKYELLADQILYQMLRAYMQTYGEMNQWGYDAVDRTSTGWKSSFVSTSTFSDGLDKKAPEEIFARFNSKKWKGDQNFPPIDSLEDMVVKWNLKVQHLYNDPPLTNAI